MKEQVPDPVDRSPGRPMDAELEKVKGLLLTKTKNSVQLAISLLQSLGPTHADYAWVFDRPVIKAVLRTWDNETWAAVSRLLLPHEMLFEKFRRLAEEAYTWHVNDRGPGAQCRGDETFNGLLLAMIPAARLRYIATVIGAAESAEPFIDFAEIPAGAFTMGSPADEADRGGDEGQVRVQITNSFAMSRTVVTQGQWRAAMGTEPWLYKDDDEEETPPMKCGDKFPAVHVNWKEAVIFCEVLTDLEHESGRLASTHSYRLPTEAEWEYACRSGTTTAYSYGEKSDELCDYAWYVANSGDELHEVAGKKPNSFGLFDMHGNVSEWCSDLYNKTLAGGTNPTGQAAGAIIAHRPLRGGHCFSDAPDCRSASRDMAIQWDRDRCWGFRVVRVEGGGRVGLPALHSWLSEP